MLIYLPDSESRRLNEYPRGKTAGYLKAKVLLLVIPVLKSTYCRYCWLVGNRVVPF